MSVGVSVASEVLAATVIEKHFTLCRVDGGVDSIFFMKPSEMAQLVVDKECGWQVLGQVSYGPTEDEKKFKQFRRSSYLVKDLNAGDLLTREKVCMPPDHGLSPKHMEALLGKKPSHVIKRGTPVTWTLFI